MTAIPNIKPCPFCSSAWIYASIGDYGSGYESYGYRIECRCGHAWKTIKWCDSENEAIKKWNAEVSNDSDT